MPRKPFETIPECPYHVSARSNGRDWFVLPLEEVWEITSRYLFFLHHAYGVRIHSFVLMTNHWHLVASFPLGNLSEAMNYFMRETSRSIGEASGRINHIYGARCFRSAIRGHHHFEHVYKYVYRNPVEVGAVKTVEEYQFSTLGASLGRSHTLIPLLEDTLLFEDVEGCLAWLNMRPQEPDRISIRNALRRPTFRLAQDRMWRRPNRLEANRY